MSVAVIIPAFNAAKYLRDTLDSVTHQRRLPDEVFIVDDGSTDATVEIARDWATRQAFPVRVLNNEFPHDGFPRRGPAGASKTALLRATADFIAPLDSDDLLMPDHLQVLEQALLRNPDLVLCFADSIEFRTGSSEPGQTVFEGKPIQKSPYREQDGLRFLDEPLILSTVRGSYIPRCSTMFRRQTAIDSNAFDRRGGGADDNLLWNGLARAGMVAYYPFVLSRRRLHEESMSADELASAWDQLNVLHVWMTEKANLRLNPAELALIAKVRREYEAGLLYQASSRGLLCYKDYLAKIKQLGTANRLHWKDLARAAAASTPLYKRWKVVPGAGLEPARWSPTNGF